MSAGHEHHGVRGVSARTIDKYRRNPELLALVFRAQEINHEYDIPYLAGYSNDGHTIYIDRHLPDVIKCEEDGHKLEFDPVRFLRIHESWEKAMIDGLDFNYDNAHAVATAMEHRAVLSAGIPIHLYDGRDSKLNQYIKADAHEKLKKVPPDLDLTPYKDDNKRLLNHLLECMGGNEGKESKEEAEYESVGMAKSHCGPVKEWPARGECEYFVDPNRCTKVKGVISPKGWCHHFEKKK